MKNITPDLQAHLDDSTTTLAWCWRIVRADTTSFGFTDHDRTLSLDWHRFRTGKRADGVRSPVGLGPVGRCAGRGRRADVGPDH